MLRKSRSGFVFLYLLCAYAYVFTQLCLCPSQSFPSCADIFANNEINFVCLVVLPVFMRDANRKIAVGRQEINTRIKSCPAAFTARVIVWQKDSRRSAGIPNCRVWL